MADRPILVAGGGIGGLAAALALGRKGHDVRLLEQADEFGEVGAGLQLGPNVFRMFRQLELTEAVSDLAFFPRALVMRDGFSGDEIIRVPVNTPEFSERFTYPYGVIFRPDLHRILVDACRAVPGIELELGRNVVAHEDNGDSVTVTCADGTRHEGAGLLGADGLWSGIRNSVVGDGAPRVAGHVAYRAVLPIEQVPPHLQFDTVVAWVGARTHLVQYRLHRGDIMNLVAVFHSDRHDQGWDVFGDPAELHASFSGQCADVQALLERIESWRMWVLCDREPARCWSRGRVGLLGDAAHPTLQYLAQGACMAIEDAVCLADRLERCGGDVAAALERYQSDRYLRTARVQLTSRFYGEVFHLSGAAADLRNYLLGDRSLDDTYKGMAWLYSGVDDTGGQIMDPNRPGPTRHPASE